MKTFYKITTDGLLKVGSGNATPTDFIDYVAGSEPQELLDALQLNLNAKKMALIDARLAQIDLDSLRPLRAFSNGNASTFDIDKLLSLDDEAATLRVERASYEPKV